MVDCMKGSEFLDELDLSAGEAFQFPHHQSRFMEPDCDPII